MWKIQKKKHKNLKTLKIENLYNSKRKKVLVKIQNKNPKKYKIKFWKL
jgi:hypothetical protein